MLFIKLRHILDYYRSKLLKKSLDQKIKIFLQVNTSGEEEKSGFDNFEELDQAVQKLKGQESWELAGLMTIGSIRADDFEKAARNCFEQLVAGPGQLQPQGFRQVVLELKTLWTLKVDPLSADGIGPGP